MPYKDHEKQKAVSRKWIQEARKNNPRYRYIPKEEYQKGINHLKYLESEVERLQKCLNHVQKLDRCWKFG